jgi:CBS domain-containing protein
LFTTSWLHRFTVKPSTTVEEAAQLFLEKGISAAPVVDSQQRLVGLISEGDLLHRVEAGT